MLLHSTFAYTKYFFITGYYYFLFIISNDLSHGFFLVESLALMLLLCFFQ